MRTLLAVLVLLLAPGDPPGAAAPPEEKVDLAVRVERAVRAAAEAEAARPAKERRAGDELALHCIRTAAGAAGDSPRAFAVGLASAVGAFRSEPAEGDATRGPTLRGRHDLWLHWVESARLATTAGAENARRFGWLKETRDASGSSGFSFVDLLANEAGIGVAAWLEEAPRERLRRLALVEGVADLLPPLTGLEEGLDGEAFREKYGDLKSEAFRAAVGRLQERVRELALFEEPEEEEVSSPAKD